METYEQYKARLTAELDKIVAEHTEEELRKRFFKPFGCLNMASHEHAHECALARAYHERHQKAHPEMHDLHEYERYRCYHETECKCGFEEACDSSD